MQTLMCIYIYIYLFVCCVMLITLLWNEVEAEMRSRLTHVVMWCVCLMCLWRVGRGREPWERSEASGVNDNGRHLHHSPVSSPTEELRKDKRRPGPLSSCTVVAPPFILPELLRGTRDRWVVQVSPIIINSTGLAPFPRLSAPPHSSQCLNVHNKHSLLWPQPALSWTFPKV